jgi:hypothetical protein
MNKWRGTLSIACKTAMLFMPFCFISVTNAFLKAWCLNESSMRQNKGIKEGVGDDLKGSN